MLIDCRLVQVVNSQTSPSFRDRSFFACRRLLKKNRQTEEFSSRKKGDYYSEIHIIHQVVRRATGTDVHQQTYTPQHAKLPIQVILRHFTQSKEILCSFITFTIYGFDIDIEGRKEKRVIRHNISEQERHSQATSSTHPIQRSVTTFYYNITKSPDTPDIVGDAVAKQCRALRRVQCLDNGRDQ